MAEGSIARTLRVLEAVCSSGPANLKSLSGETGLAPPTLLRILRLMAEEGYVHQEDDRTWRGTMLVWRLGCMVNSVVGIESVAREHTDRLTATLEETSVYAVYDQDAVTYATHAEPASPVHAHVRPGRRLGLLATTTGKAVLAWLDPSHVEPAWDEQRAAGDATSMEAVVAELNQIRADGYASGFGRLWPDLWGAAAPVFDSSGVVVGALGVSVPASHLEQGGEKTIAAVVAEAALMTRQLGGGSGPTRLRD